MNVFEVEGICPIFRDILDMALDIMDCPPSVGISSAEFLTINHLKIRLHSWICMYPHINEAVKLFCLIFPWFCLGSALLGGG